jgi:hypothetical protein
MFKQASLAAALTLCLPLAYAESFCVPGPGDRPETGLQGSTSKAEREAPGGFQGHWCGARKVGQHALFNRGSFGDVQLIGLCAYASMRDPSVLTALTTGTAVVDVRVPSQPVIPPSADNPNGLILRTPAMIRAYSALELQGNIMVGAFKDFGPTVGGVATNPLDVYDVSDCLNPRPLSTTFNTASGNHDGWLTPDAKTYYGIPFGGARLQANPNRIDMHVTDLSDPTQPRHLMNWNRLQLPAEIQALTVQTTNFHDVSTNQAGTRVYMALYGGNNSLGGNNNNPNPALNQRCSNGLLILDSSDIANRVPNPQLRFVSWLSWCDQQLDPDFGDGSSASSHATEYVVHENGKEYIVSTDESGGGLNGNAAGVCAQRTYSRFIDISDERNPRVVATFKPDVNKPEHCAANLATETDGGMLHYIGFDDRNKMRLVFYASANQGIRVVDFRDPANPREIAYYLKEAHSTTAFGEVDFTRPDPRYDAENCLLYTGWNQGGLVSIELTNPEHNPCMRRAVNGGGFLAGTRTNIGFDVGRANGGLGALQGSLSLNDRGANAKIDIDQVTYLSGVRDQCGSILPAANAVQFNATGTFNGAPASFRVCVQDGGEGKKASGPDRFFLTCTAGCSYSANATLGNGNIDVRQR